MKLQKLSLPKESEIIRFILACLAVAIALLMVFTTRTPAQTNPAKSPISTVGVQKSTTPPSAIGLRPLAASSMMNEALQARVDAEQAARDALQDRIDAENERLAAELAARDAAQDLIDRQNEALAAQQEAADAAAEQLAVVVPPTPETIPTDPAPSTPPASGPTEEPSTPPTTPETPPTTDTPPPTTGDITPVITAVLPGLLSI